MLLVLRVATDQRTGQGLDQVSQAFSLAGCYRPITRPRTRPSHAFSLVGCYRPITRQVATDQLQSQGLDQVSQAFSLALCQRPNNKQKMSGILK